MKWRVSLFLISWFVIFVYFFFNFFFLGFFLNYVVLWYFFFNRLVQNAVVRNLDFTWLNTKALSGDLYVCEFTYIEICIYIVCEFVKIKKILAMRSKIQL